MSDFTAEMPGTRLPEGLATLVESNAFPLNPARRLEPGGLRTALKRLPRGDFLLFADRFRTLKTEEALAHLVVVDDLARTRTESANEVYFGQLIVQASIDEERAELVAVKPLSLPKVAAAEYGATVFINNLEADRPRPLSFVPLGFYRDPEDGSTALITRYDHAVRSFDNVFWRPGVPSEQQVGRALGYCAASLGYMHVNGLVHGDAQIKNQATDGEGVRYIDLTDTRLVPDISSNGFSLRHAIADDVRTLLGSLSRGAENSGTAPDYTEAVYAHFAEPYASFVAESHLPPEARLSPPEIMQLTA